MKPAFPTDGRGMEAWNDRAQLVPTLYERRAKTPPQPVRVTHVDSGKALTKRQRRRRAKGQ